MQNGKGVTCYGDNVSLEGAHSWQKKKLWINLKGGASVAADYRDVRSMEIS
jgi:hypothetical protein